MAADLTPRPFLLRQNTFKRYLKSRPSIMLNQIHPATSAGKPGALELLTACHDRIRHFTSVVRKLAHSEGAPLREISDAANSAFRYFTVALPLHEADEEDSLRPRLLEHSTPEVHAALEAMTHQHQAIDDLIERLTLILVLLSNNPAMLPETHGELCTLSTALAEVFEGHLNLEEKAIFPSVAMTLSQSAQDALLREMQGRRKQG
jgi:hemerythrin-like domain-containing protein